MRRIIGVVCWFILGSNLTGCASFKLPTLPSARDAAANDDRSGIPNWLNPSKSISYFKGPPPDETASRTLYAQANEHFQAASSAQGEARKEAFLEAAKLFDRSAERGQGFAVGEDALMMKAESYFFADDYPEASVAYAELAELYPNSDHLDRIDNRRFRIAQYWLDVKKDASRLAPNLTNSKIPFIDTFGNSIKLYDRIRFDNPTGEMADDATMAAAVAKFQRASYSEADELLTDLRDSFPDSEHQFQAHFLGLKAKLMSYEGPDYDGGALDEADELIRRMVTLFPDEARENYDVLNEAHSEIRLKKAEREYRLAKYYDRRKDVRAARILYGNVRQDFADTNLAVESEGRIAQLEGEPEVAKNKFEWVANLFPEEETRPKPLWARSPVGKARK